MKGLTILVAVAALVLGIYSYLHPSAVKYTVMRMAFDGLLKEKFMPTAGLEDLSAEARVFAVLLARCEQQRCEQHVSHCLSTHTQYERGINATSSREGSKAAAQALPPLTGVHVTPFLIGNVPVTWFAPPHLHTNLTVLYFHGGGMVTGSAVGEGYCASYLALHLRARVLSVDYRLVPEHTLQHALDDALAVYRYLLRMERVQPQHLVLYGCSAGGFMTLATALALRSAALPQPAGIVPLAVSHGFEHLPGCTPRSAWASRQYAQLTVYAMLPPSRMDWFDSVIALDPRNADTMRALYSDLSGLAPMLMQVAEYDPLRDGVVQLSQALTAAGNSVEFTVLPRVFHCISAVADKTPEGKQAIGGHIAWIRQQVAN